MIGRWWALLLALVPGIWVTAVEEVEVPGWILGLSYAAIAAAGIAAGVATRRIASR